MCAFRRPRRTSETPIRPGCSYASVSRDFLVESGSCSSPCMSVDGYLHGTRRGPLFLCFSCLYPLQEFVFEESPQLSLPLAKRVRWYISETGPNYKGASVHAKNLCCFLSIEKM